MLAIAYQGFIDRHAHLVLCSCNLTQAMARMPSSLAASTTCYISTLPWGEVPLLCASCNLRGPLHGCAKVGLLCMKHPH